MAGAGQTTPGYTAYDPTKHKAMLIEHAREFGEVGFHRYENGEVDWDKLLWLFEGEHHIELPGTNDDPAITAYKRAYRKAYKDGNE